MTNQRKQYPSDVSDGEREFCTPYLTLMREDAQQRDYALRELLNAVRYVVSTGCQWRYLPPQLSALERSLSTGQGLVESKVL